MTGEELYERYLDSLHFINKETDAEWQDMSDRDKKVWDYLAEQFHPKSDRIKPVSISG